jgi:hypothetical protein
MFLRAEKRASKHHVSPHHHHKFTIKKPRFAHAFLQNPCKNALPPRQKKIIET